MEHFIVECDMEKPFTPEEEKASSQSIDRYLEAHQGRWIRSYLNPERTRMICEFEAPDLETVRKAWEEANCSIDSIWPASVFQREVVYQE